MSEETGSWQSRKEAVRAAYARKWQIEGDPTLQAELLANLVGEPTEEGELRNPVIPGAAAPLTASAAVHSAPKVVPSGSPFSGTSATATALSVTPASPHASSTRAESTNPSSDASTAWMVSPLTFSEQNLKSSIVDPLGSLVPGLPSALHASLQALATARAERVEDTILLIAEFFVENEDERAEGTLLDAVTFYMENYG